MWWTPYLSNVCPASHLWLLLEIHAFPKLNKIEEWIDPSKVAYQAKYMLTSKRRRQINQRKPHVETVKKETKP